MLPGWLQQLDLPDNLTVEDKEHIGDHTEHEDLDTNHDEQYGEDCKRNMLNITEPFENHIDSDQDPQKARKQSHHTKIKHRVVHPREPVDGAHNLDPVMERRELGPGSPRPAQVLDGHNHDPLPVAYGFYRYLGLDLKPALF